MSTDVSHPETPDEDHSTAVVDLGDHVILSGKRGFVALSRERFNSSKSWANRTFDKYRNRPLVDFGMRMYERDRDSAGTVVSSAIAFRLFLFFIPMLLFAVGIIGFFATHVDANDVKDAGVTGSLAKQINTALNQPNSTRWFAVLFGLVFMGVTGRTLSRVLTQASCLAWQMPVRPKAPIKVVGGIIGLIFGIALVTSGVARIRAHLGIAVASMSFLVALLVYLVAFLILSSLLPRPTPDLGALLPGAALVSLTLVGMQAVSQLYLPDKFSRASQLYGAMGVTIVTLGWFFIAGRVIMLAIELDSVLYERFGSLTQFIFSLPVLRVLPRHSALLRKYFGLERSPIAGGAAMPAESTAPPPLSEVPAPETPPA
ncbi:MAG: YhjD/YihY/BrkB family envelope integrity protein [Ilumatobacteraceae bacterium]